MNDADEAINKVSSNHSWAVIDGYGPTVARPDNYRDALHPDVESFGPLNAQLLEATFMQRCKTTLQALRQAHEVAGLD